MSTPRSFNSSLLSLALVLAIGVFLRLPPSLFQKPGGPLYSIAALHPNPEYTSTGFEEGLYRVYVYALIQYGISPYANIVEAFRTVLIEKTALIIYIFHFLLIFELLLC